MMNQEPAKARKRYKKNKPKRILSAAEKKIFNKQKTDATGRFNQTTGRPKSTYDRSGLDTSRLVKDLKPKKGEVIQDEFSAPTNSMGGGAIAGSVEAGDNPPVNKKKKKGEPTLIARGRMPGARGRFKGGVELLASLKKNKYT